MNYYIYVAQLQMDFDDANSPKMITAYTIRDIASKLHMGVNTVRDIINNKASSKSKKKVVITRQPRPPPLPPLEAKAICT